MSERSLDIPHVGISVGASQNHLLGLKVAIFGSAILLLLFCALGSTDLHDVRLSTGAIAHRKPTRVVASSACNGMDYTNSPGSAQIERAQKLMESFDLTTSKQHRALVETVILVSNFDSNEVESFRHQGWDKVIVIPHNSLRFRTKLERDESTFWTLNEVQGRQDGLCTALKLFYWNLTEYTSITHLDTDICLKEDIVPWILRMEQDDMFFAATREREQRSYDGLNTHVMFLRPSSDIFTLLQQKSEYGEFVPFTNTEQDVLETVFSTEGSSVQMFLHEHSKSC